jgi:hypothetical protein
MTEDLISTMASNNSPQRRPSRVMSKATICVPGFDSGAARRVKRKVPRDSAARRPSQMRGSATSPGGVWISMRRGS